MFVAAVGGGVIGVVAIVGIGGYDDHSDHYSRYSDGAMLVSINKKESEVKEHKSQIERLRRLTRENLAEFIADLKDDQSFAPFIPSCSVDGDTGVKQLETLSAQAAKRIEQKLQDEIREDEKELHQLDSLLQKINDMRFK